MAIIKFIQKNIKYQGHFIRNPFDLIDVYLYWCIIMIVIVVIIPL